MRPIVTFLASNTPCTLQDKAIETTETKMQSKQRHVDGTATGGAATAATGAGPSSPSAAVSQQQPQAPQQELSVAQVRPVHQAVVLLTTASAVNTVMIRAHLLVSNEKVALYGLRHQRGAFSFPAKRKRWHPHFHPHC